MLRASLDSCCVWRRDIGLVYDGAELACATKEHTASVCLCFAASVIADLATTMWFFHTHGIEFELHPGIRLMGYAYGRTIGPFAGKTIQAIGILLVSVLMPEQWRGKLLLLAAIGYFAAAVYNLAQ